MTTVAEKYRLNPPLEGQVTGLRSNHNIPSNQLIGIEVEVENVIGTQLPRNTVWHAVADGSLRNDGMEFVSLPIKASSAPAALEQLLSDVLNQACHFSPRTSVHVHLNVQDMEVSQAIDLVMLYAVFEKLFYKFAGRGRIRNIYCVPITETKLLTRLVEKGLGEEWSKYTGLNLTPIRGTGRGSDDRREGAYGTVEFRQMHGTFSVEKLCQWIDLITSLKEYILKSSTKDFRAMMHSMDDSFDFNKLLNEVFGEKAQWLKYDGFGDVRHTYMAAKSAMLSSRTITRIMGSSSSDSLFLKFKG